jgi:hypothetical protein
VPSASVKVQPRSPRSVEQAFLKLCGRTPSDAQKSFIAQAAADWGDDGLPGWSTEDLARLAFELWTAAETRGEDPLIRLRAGEGPTPVELLETRHSWSAA